MNIRKVSYSLLGGLMLAGAVTSCSNDTYVNKAKSDAVEYLNGDELLKAERFASQQPNHDNFNGKAIEYWDSLLIEAKSREAYIKGKNLIIDSLNGKHHRKEKYKAPLDTIITEPYVIESAKNEYAKYTTAHDFINARDNAPKEKNKFNNDLVGTTHYWNLITMSGKQKEAYRKGMADERKKLMPEKYSK